MARAVVDRQRNPLWSEIVERVFPDPDLLMSLDEEPSLRQARVLCFRDNDLEESFSRRREREEALAR